MITGLVIGFFIGGILGILAMALLVAGRAGDEGARKVWERQ